jgi:hypothetical protein
MDSSLAVLSNPGGITASPWWQKSSMGGDDNLDEAMMGPFFKGRSPRCDLSVSRCDVGRSRRGKSEAF